MMEWLTADVTWSDVITLCGIWIIFAVFIWD